MNIDTQTLEAASAAGQFLLQAAATLGTLSPEQQTQLAESSALPALLAASLRSAEHLCPEVRRSMKTHPPRGFHAPL